MNRGDKVQELKSSYENVQKKTFTKWMNSFVKDRGYEIQDLFTELGDGKALTLLLEKLSGETLVCLSFYGFFSLLTHLFDE
jgi:spectrin beta